MNRGLALWQTKRIPVWGTGSRSPCNHFHSFEKQLLYPSHPNSRCLDLILIIPLLAPALSFEEHATSGCYGSGGEVLKMLSRAYYALPSVILIVMKTPRTALYYHPIKSGSVSRVQFPIVGGRKGGQVRSVG